MTNQALTVMLVVGFGGQILFFSRFLVQWIISEYRRESVIPEVFWYLSIAGSSLLLTYAIYRKDPVFILGQSVGFVVYIRNIILINKKKKREKTIQD
ncbi:MAG: lipid-A-disaccharide synthase N-terminal domain-containing protein [Candidatus Auribacterota bacterium]|jgi:lipid-A-disaccharide synthase-like uncharacterized protein|uniref:Lipid A biosynthesis N-terminal domain-containing protein n=1 Tax=Candidatus Auribacter fodinae TaxID=2093366 RepID=A0A3A4RA90_9BACT|nr:MAG: hypothetical protein C4541_00950 [Candidatus Auribacter fodinae]